MVLEFIDCTRKVNIYPTPKGSLKDIVIFSLKTKFMCILLSKTRQPVLLNFSDLNKQSSKSSSEAYVFRILHLDLGAKLIYLRV